MVLHFEVVLMKEAFSCYLMPQIYEMFSNIIKENLLFFVFTFIIIINAGTTSPKFVTDKLISLHLKITYLYLQRPRTKMTNDQRLKKAFS